MRPRRRSKRDHQISWSKRHIGTSTNGDLSPNCADHVRDQQRLRRRRHHHSGRQCPHSQPRKKSNAVWWILGGLAAALVIGVGLVVMFIALASLGANANNSNLNANTRNENRNSNISANTNTNVNSTNTNANLPGSLADDFSEQKWGVGNSQYGRIWYDGGEYHMVSKEKTFVVMYAPSDTYNTENARVSVTARSVDGGVPSSGFGLMVHGTLKSGKLEDYALLIYPSEEPAYQIIMHKNGTQHRSSMQLNPTRSNPAVLRTSWK